MLVDDFVFGADLRDNQERNQRVSQAHLKIHPAQLWPIQITERKNEKVYVPTKKNSIKQQNQNKRLTF